MKFFYVCFLAIISAITFAQVNLGNGLQACYPFTGNANDLKNNLNGIVTGTVTQTNGHTGNVNDAYQFFGSNNSFIQLPDTNFLKPTNYLSFSAWIKPGLISSPTQYMLFTKNTGTSNFETYALTLSNNGLLTVVKSFSNGITAEASYSPALTAGTWYHAAFTMGNDSIKLFVNGQLKSTKTTTIAFNYQSGKKVYLGGTNESVFPASFTGVIDNVLFYNRKLNGSEVYALYSMDPACNAVGLNEFSDSGSSLKVFPNPNNGKFIIQNAGNNKIEISDILGRNIKFSSQSINGNTEVYITQVGIYFVRLIGENNSVTGITKVVVE